MSGRPGRDEPPATGREFWHWLGHEATPAERRNAAVLAATVVVCALVVLAALGLFVAVVASVLLP